MRKIKFTIFLFATLFGFHLFAQEAIKKDSASYEYYPDQTKTEVTDAQSTNQPQGQKSDISEKLFFGGGFGAGFGNYTFISVSPIIGYRVTSRLATGVRFMYQYTTFEYIDQNLDKERYNGNDFGVSPFARFMVYGPAFLQAEYEYMSYDALFYDGTKRRANFDSFLAGAGIAQPIGQRAAFFLTVLYNFSYENFDNTGVYRSPYDSPWVFRVGISGGF
jgi:hypothetical protein